LFIRQPLLLASAILYSMQLDDKIREMAENLGADFFGVADLAPAEVSSHGRVEGKWPNIPEPFLSALPCSTPS
jgi:hypothetical protein